MTAAQEKNAGKCISRSATPRRREFARNGLAGTSTQAIAQSAGITKAELYRQVLGHIVKQWREIFFLAPAQEEPATVITAYIGRKLRHALEYPDISRLFANEIARGAPEMAGHWDDLKASVEEANRVIRRWIDAGRIAPVDPLLFQINLWAGCRGALPVLELCEYEPANAMRSRERAIVFDRIQIRAADAAWNASCH